ncbi:MAG: hypothetical protein JSV91_03410 [Phycisphaerales bacterium]|nr:MAG: hypothetical protein JSV91_03410 [Phycisphaerales bacterium]
MAAPDSESEQFVSEPITPEPGAFRTDLMSRGLASLPAAFTWRGDRYEIVECLDHQKQSAREGHTADGERYLRRQTFQVLLNTGQRATIYVQRHARAGASRKAAKRRWYLYSITSGDKTAP